MIFGKQGCQYQVLHCNLACWLLETYLMEEYIVTDAIADIDLEFGQESHLL